MRYLRWLNEKMDFVKFELDSQDKQIESIRLTSQGISFCKNKLFENECMIKNSSEHTFA
jgi:hypothetical protein